MSKYILESKDKFPPSIGNQPIYLYECMMFKNEVDLKKCGILKFKNQSAYDIRKIEVEIEQLNDRGETISKPSYYFEELHVYESKYLIPSKKIKVNESCLSIKYKLLSVESKQGTWNNGTWKTKETDEKTEQKKITYNVVSLKHKNPAFLFFITLGFLLAYVIAVIAVFNVLNP